jgi:energy-coupling factor transporter ATP-binding protein EcfA2
MKVTHIHLENFKRFSRLDIPVRNSLTEDVAAQFLILGDNGSGKTTVLQAVALALSMACGKTWQVADFNWLGWMPGRYERWGTPVVELEVQFEDDEIAATQEAAHKWLESRNAAFASERTFVMPAAERTVRLRLEGGTCRAQSQAAYYQFRGRTYASAILNTDPRARALFERLPGVFWFDQLRNLGTLTPEANGGGKHEEENGRISYSVGVSRLRQHLNKMHLDKLVLGPRPYDFLDEIKRSYQRIFPSRSFGILEPMFTDGVPSPADYYFILDDGNRTYDIEEMSAGEQAVFPILYEFVRQRIKNSVVLIDEIDLNLHSPLAQAFVRALPTMGPNCQFLLTTHSEAVTSVISSANVHRLAGGNLCL